MCIKSSLILVSTLRAGYVHVFDDAPVVIARDKGFFAAQGLDATVTAFTSGPTLVKGLVTGQLDIGILGFTNAITWRLKARISRSSARCRTATTP